MAMVRAHLMVSGRVQGVFYRASTQEEGVRLGLKGWVRNLPDGRVEALVEGPEPDVEHFIGWCKVGPPAARVDEVDVQREGYTGEFRSFAVTG